MGLLEVEEAPQEISWPELAERYNFNLSGPLTPFSTSQALVHDVVTGVVRGVQPVSLSELDGRVQRALRECAGLSVQNFQFLFSMTGSLLRTVEAGDGRYAPELMGDSDCPVGSGQGAMKGLALLFGAIQNWRAFMESTGNPVPLVFAPTEAELVEAEFRAEAEARAADPFLDLRRAAAAAYVEDNSTIAYVSTTGRQWSNNGDVNKKFLDQWTPRVALEMLGTIDAQRQRIAELEADQ
ncbi:MAG: hypothetical protein JF603_03965 [Acidobacteria bacterium]|nr:hypothetical protein [Acidobacteriota bacterium]